MDVLCSKEINKEKLELTSEFSIFFTFQQGLATSWQHVDCQFLCQHLDRGSKVLLGFLEEKLKTSMHVNFGLICTFSDQIQNYSILINKVKDWTFRFQKNKYTCLIMTSNENENLKMYPLSLNWLELQTMPYKKW